jgi:hypothetical protein
MEKWRSFKEFPPLGEQRPSRSLRLKRRIQKSNQSVVLLQECPEAGFSSPTEGDQMECLCVELTDEKEEEMKGCTCPLHQDCRSGKSDHMLSEHSPRTESDPNRSAEQPSTPSFRVQSDLDSLCLPLTSDSECSSLVERDQMLLEECAWQPLSNQSELESLEYPQPSRRFTSDLQCASPAESDQVLLEECSLPSWIAECKTPSPRYDRFGSHHMVWQNEATNSFYLPEGILGGHRKSHALLLKTGCRLCSKNGSNGPCGGRNFKPGAPIPCRCHECQGSRWQFEAAIGLWVPCGNCGGTGMVNHQFCITLCNHHADRNTCFRPSCQQLFSCKESHREYCIWLQIMLVHSLPSWYQEAEKHVVGVLETHSVWKCLTDEDFHRVIEMLLQAPNLKGSFARTRTEEAIVHYAHELATDRFGCRVLNAALKLLSIQEEAQDEPSETLQKLRSRFREEHFIKEGWKHEFARHPLQLALETGNAADWWAHRCAITVEDGFDGFVNHRYGSYGVKALIKNQKPGKEKEYVELLQQVLSLEVLVKAYEDIKNKKSKRPLPAFHAIAQANEKASVS